MELATEELAGGALLVRLTGRLDMRGADEISLPLTASLANRATPVVVDLAGVSYLASIGIRTLIMNAKAVNKRGGKLVLAGPSPEVLSVLSTAGILEILPTAETVEAAAALASLD